MGDNIRAQLESKYQGTAAYLAQVEKQDPKALVITDRSTLTPADESPNVRASAAKDHAQLSTLDQRMKKMLGPPIIKCERGELCVNTEEGLQKFKDAIIQGYEPFLWDWRLTKTQYSPGITQGVVESFLDRDVKFVVLSRGFEKRLEVDFDTAAFERQHGVRVFVNKTPEAVAVFNKLVIEHGDAVLGFFHSTG